EMPLREYNTRREAPSRVTKIESDDSVNHSHESDRQQIVAACLRAIQHNPTKMAASQQLSTDAVNQLLQGAVQYLSNKLSEMEARLNASIAAQFASNRAGVDALTTKVETLSIGKTPGKTPEKKTQSVNQWFITNYIQNIDGFRDEVDAKYGARLEGIFDSSINGEALLR